MTVAETVADTNTGPAFSSADAFTVTEHEASVGTVTAADSDTEDSVTGYTLGGTDGDLFEITLDGALRFVAPPDFEKPEDETQPNAGERCGQQRVRRRRDRRERRRHTAAHGGPDDHGDRRG